MTAFAKSVGADACLLVTPYYNKPSPAGVLAHVKAVAAVGLPIMLYNIPGRAGINIPAPAIALKDAAGSVEMTSEVASLCDITILSGDDTLTLPMMAVGKLALQLDTRL
jgi:4-hydroxy-tetrahydrodipicolinate synthase